MTPGKLLPDKIKGKEGERGMRRQAGGAGTQKQRVVEQEVESGKRFNQAREKVKGAKEGMAHGEGQKESGGKYI